MSQVSVVYIGGVEHNGSTFFGVALGNHPQAVCVGELSSLAREGWLGEYTCACGEAVRDCTFWSEVQEVFRSMGGANVVSDLARLEDDFDRHRRLPRVWLENQHRSNNFLTYIEYQGNLFKSIETVSGATVIVDTSKRFSRALALSMVPDIDLKIIHLVRDARGVAYSWSKPIRPRQRSWLDSTLRWNVTNLAFELIRTTLPETQFMRLNYENLLRDPVDTLGNAREFIGLDLKDVAVRLRDEQPLAAGHIGIGNGFLRREQEVRMQATTSWPHKLPAATQSRVWHLARFLMRRYGYDRQS